MTKLSEIANRIVINLNGAKIETVVDLDVQTAAESCRETRRGDCKILRNEVAAGTFRCVSGARDTGEACPNGLNLASEALSLICTPPKKLYKEFLLLARKVVVVVPLIVLNSKVSSL